MELQSRVTPALLSESLNAPAGFGTSTSMPVNGTSNGSPSTTVREVSTAPTASITEEAAASSQGTDALSQLSQLSQIAAAQQPLAGPSRTTSGTTPAPRSGLSAGPTAAGQKRTADGLVKSPSDVGKAVQTTQSPRTAGRCGHSRNPSAVSNISTASSRIGELSSELRTRLSYAMVKVNNGWQSNSIDEVESLASQTGSPTSSTSTLHGRRHTIASPRAVMANMQGTTFQSISSLTQAVGGDFDLYPKNEAPSRTYESFWRNHVASNGLSQGKASSPPLKSALAPSAEIRPTHHSRRTSNSRFTKPPAIPQSGSGSTQHSSFNSGTPNTPNRLAHDFADGAMIKTPAQKTIQEQDAIETLLFMSSPGNSGKMPTHHTFPAPPPLIQNAALSSCQHYNSQGSTSFQPHSLHAHPRSHSHSNARLHAHSYSHSNSPLRPEFGPRGASVRGAMDLESLGFMSMAAAGSLERGGEHGSYSIGRSKMSVREQAATVERQRREALDRLLDEMADEDESSTDDEGGDGDQDMSMGVGVGVGLGDYKSPSRGVVSGRV